MANCCFFMSIPIPEVSGRECTSISIKHNFAKYVSDHDFLSEKHAHYNSTNKYSFYRYIGEQVTIKV